MGVITSVLPKEMWMLVTSYLTTKEDRNRAALVSQFFCDLVREHRLNNATPEMFNQCFKQITYNPNYRPSQLFLIFPDYANRRPLNEVRMYPENILQLPEPAIRGWYEKGKTFFLFRVISKTAESNSFFTVILYQEKGLLWGMASFPPQERFENSNFYEEFLTSTEKSHLDQLAQMVANKSEQYQLHHIPSYIQKAYRISSEAAEFLFITSFSGFMGCASWLLMFPLDKQLVLDIAPNLIKTWIVIITITIANAFFRDLVASKMRHFTTLKI